jgi:predicted nucleotidyltransferase component of viral defense system
MLDKEKHKLIMLKILKDIYSDIELASLLGFKGGTATYLFYELDRFSVDLDFDLIGEADKKEKEKIFEKVKKIALKYGDIKNDYIKRSTIFMIVSYGEADHNIKIEISTRKTNAKYELKNFLGISMLVSSKESLLAGKLMALTNRKKATPRDIYDIYHAFNQGWNIDEEYLKDRGEESLKEYLEKCVNFIEGFPQNKMLVGMGDLIDEKQKAFIKNKLKKEVIFLLKAYLSSLE